jgi:hypothetical protein
MDAPTRHFRAFDFCAVCIHGVLRALHEGDLPVLHLAHASKAAVAAHMLMHCRTPWGDPLPVDLLLHTDGDAAGCGATDAQASAATRALLRFDSRVWRDAVHEHDLWDFVWPCHPSARAGDHDTPLDRACGRPGCRCAAHISAWTAGTCRLWEAPQYPCRVRNRQKIVA